MLRPSARRDLVESWTYTERSRGREQADAYLIGIGSAIERAAEQPELGSDRSEVRPGLRKVRAGAHAIYYFRDKHVLRVSRVLHARRLAEGKL